MPVNNILLFIALAVNLGLGFLIRFRYGKNETNIAFSHVLFSCALWVASFLFFANAADLGWILFFRRAVPVGSAAIAAYLLYFSLVFPNNPNPLTPVKKLMLLIPPYILGMVSIFTPAIIKSFDMKGGEQAILGSATLGILYPIYTAYLTIYFSISLVNLLRKFVEAKDRARLQLFYAVFGICFAVVFGLIVSLFLPILGYANLYSSGYIATLILAGFVAYSIVKHKLLGIEGFLSRSIFFIFGAGAILGTFYFLEKGQLNSIFTLYVILANLVLGTFVISQNFKSKANISFFLITICVAFWAFGVSTVWHSTRPEALLFVGRLTFLFVSFLPALLLLFVKSFPREIKPLNNFQWGMVILPIIIWPVLIMQSHVLKQVALAGASVNRVYGPAYPIFLAYYLVYFAIFFYELYLKQKALSGTSRTQVRYVLLGFGASGLIGLTTNLILPFYGIGTLSFIGPNASLILVAIISYAILKHRLMSIEVIIQRSVSYAVVTTMIMFAYAFTVIMSETFFRKITGYSSVVVIALATLVMAIIYHPLVILFQTLADNIFFHGRYDYRKTLREVGHRISSVIKFEDLTALIVSVFIEKMKISEVSLMILDKDKKRYRAVPISYTEGASRYKRIEIDENSSIAAWLKNSKDILFLDELEDKISKLEEGSSEIQILKDVKDEMERLGSALWVPIISKNELSGIMFLGSKLSGDIYTAEDLNLLLTLADQIAIALENSRLYSEVLSVKNYTEDVLNSMVSGVITTDIHGDIITFNPTAERITGIPAINAINHEFRKLFSPKSAIGTVLEQTLQGRFYNNYETNVVSGTRGIVPVSLNSRLLLDSAGKKTGVLLSLLDLSEVKELEDKVRRADKIGALGTMAAGMAHEIKNPLSSMKVLSQLLPQKYGDQEFRDKFIEIMQREISRIDRIVESLLGFARAASPKFSIVDINEIIENDVKYFGDKAKASSVKITTSYAKLPQIEGDPDQLSQVFSNLILNAIQAMQEGGELKITTREGRKIENILQTIEIEVVDRGHGIPKESLKKLFDPFFTTKHAGTGLGLTITHSIVDGHKGLIDVKSEVGYGTAFTVSLPVKQELV